MALTAYIDLNTGEIDIKESPKRLMRKYLGSRGYAAKLLYDNVGPEIKPFDSDNLLIFSTGMFTGTAWPTGARFTVTAKSPLTGAYGYANSGGYLGPKIKQAGFDALVIKGKADKPIYLLVEDEKIKMKNAEEYWGKKINKVNKALIKKHKGSKIACIGPAGENKVRFSSVIVDGGRAAGRCGMGAVMGSKRVKAVVAKSNRKVKFSDEFKKIAISKAKKVMKNEAAQNYRKWGTPILINFKNNRGDLPAKNHQLAQVPDQTKINAQAVDEYVYKTSGCYACPIRCSRHTRVESGKYKCETEGPEYETIASFSSMVWNDNMEMIIYANNLCDELGLDTISTGTVIAFAMECYEKGHLDSELDLQWGNDESIINLIKKIAYRQGLGDILAEGVKRGSKKLGSETEKFAMHVKGLETPHQEPRTNRGLALGHVTSNRGADHLYGLSTIDQTQNEGAAQRFFPDSDENILNVFSQKYKPRMLKFTEEFSAVSDALGICKFSTVEGYALNPEDIAQGINSFSNLFDLDGKELLKIGERIVNLERMYNIRHGFNKKQDVLPDRFLNEPLSLKKEEEGKLTDNIYIENLVVDLDEMLIKYYQKRGWDKNGIPTLEKLKELNLKELITDLKGVE